MKENLENPYMEDRRDWEDRNAVEEEIFFFFFSLSSAVYVGFNLKLEFKVSSPCAAAAFDNRGGMDGPVSDCHGVS